MRKCPKCGLVAKENPVRCGNCGEYVHPHTDMEASMGSLPGRAAHMNSVLFETIVQGALGLPNWKANPAIRAKAASLGISEQAIDEEIARRQANPDARRDKPAIMLNRIVAQGKAAKQHAAPTLQEIRLPNGVNITEKSSDDDLIAASQMYLEQRWEPGVDELSTFSRWFEARNPDASRQSTRTRPWTKEELKTQLAKTLVTLPPLMHRKIVQEIARQAMNDPNWRDLEGMSNYMTVLQITEEQLEHQILRLRTQPNT